MIHEASGPSLLSYLAPGRAGFRLGLSLVPGSGAEEDPSRSPFVPVSGSDPFTRTVEAWVMSDAGSPVRRVFLVLSRDRYAPGGHDAPEFTNALIDEGWQRSFRANRASIIALGEQDDGNGGIRPFAPLLYCRRRDLFFHPPCPSCGGSLDLCRDDGLLKGASLRPYSSSLSRYLFCPGCHAQKGASEFYAFSPGADEPAGVKDEHALVRDFAPLVSRPGAAEGFPCPSCAEADACYGSRGLAGKRLVPFSFYPFHLFVCGDSPLAVSGFGDLPKASLFRIGQGAMAEAPDAGAPAAEATAVRASVQETPAGPGPDDGAIRSILDDVIASFREEHGEGPGRAGTGGEPPARVQEEVIAGEGTRTDLQDALPGTVIASGAPVPAPEEKSPVVHEEDRLETVILTPEKISTLTKKPAAGAERKAPGPEGKSGEEGVPETVIMGSGQGVAPGTVAPRGDAPESVILTPEKTAGQGRKPGLIPSRPHRPAAAEPAVTDRDEDAAETVIMGPKTGEEAREETVITGTRNGGSRAEPAPGPAHAGLSREEEVPETVIMKPGAAGGPAPAAGDAAKKDRGKDEGDDSLEATVISRKPGT